jgi:hypothetical protein
MTSKDKKWKREAGDQYESPRSYMASRLRCLQFVLFVITNNSVH